MNTEIENVDEDGLCRKVWSFWFYPDRCALVLDSYVMEVRASRRHGWRKIKGYSRLGIGMHRVENALSLEEVPLSDGLKARAIAEFAAKVRVIAAIAR